MKKIIILCIISFLLVFCTSEEYKFNKTELTIKKINIEQLPNMNLHFKCFVNGEALGNNRTFFGNMNLNCNKQSFTIKNIAKYTPKDLKIYYITNYFSEHSVLEYETQLEDLHSDYKIYKNDEYSLTEIDDMDNTGVANLKLYWKKNGDIFVHSKTFLDSFHDRFSYKLFILFLSRDTKISVEKDKQYLSNIRKIIKKHPNWGIGIFYEKGFGRQISELQASIPQQCLFIKRFDDIKQKTAHKQLKNIAKALNLMNNSNYIVNFAFDDIKDPRQKFYDISLSARYQNILLNDSFTWEPDIEIIKNYYINNIKNSVSYFKKNNNYQALLDVYHQEYNFTQFDELYQLAEENINTWLSGIIDKLESASEKESIFKEGLKAVDLADNIWNMRTTTYLDLKEKFLIYYANYQKRNNYSFDERIKIYRSILEANPKNSSIKFDLNECEADKALANNNYPRALKYLHNAVGIDNNARIVTKLQKNLNTILTRYNKNSNFTDLNEIASKYQQYMKNDFENKVYWAKATKELHKSAKSISLYKWLLNNWRNNNIISWNRLLGDMFSVYAENMEFSDAYELIKQVCMDLKEDEADKAPDLLDAIVYLRSFYIEPFIDISRLYFINNNYTNLNSLADGFKKADLPQYFENIYILNHNNNLRKILYGSTETISLPSHYSSYSKKYIKKVNKNWYIQPIDKGYFVLQTNNHLTPSEDVRYNEFQKNFSEPSIWYREKQFFAERGRKTMIKLITIMLGNEIVRKGTTNMGTYSNIIKDIPHFKYFLIQNSNGIIVYDINFDPNNAFYKGNGWEASSSSPLFYKQKIEYGFQKKEALDITYPYFTNQNWVGVLRYGFEI